ncbi:MAG TPA: hypothetical protein VMX57_02960 [Planctomycetota bacterium]|nr:hypothetical protein [Planctomycetota bacterium]
MAGRDDGEDDAGRGPAKVDADAVLEPSGYVGLAPQQTERFVTDVVRPALGPHKKLLGASSTFDL